MFVQFVADMTADITRGEGYSLIWAIQGRAAAQGMVFRPLCPEQGIIFYSPLF